MYRKKILKNKVLEIENRGKNSPIKADMKDEVNKPKKQSGAHNERPTVLTCIKKSHLFNVFNVKCLEFYKMTVDKQGSERRQPDG